MAKKPNRSAEPKPQAPVDPAAEPAKTVKKGKHEAPAATAARVTRQPQDFTLERQREAKDDADGPVTQTEPVQPPPKAAKPAKGDGSARTRDHADVARGQEVFVESVVDNRPTITARRVKDVRGRDLVFEHWDDQPGESPAGECFKDLSVAWAVTKIRRVEG